MATTIAGVRRHNRDYRKFAEWLFSNFEQRHCMPLTAFLEEAKKQIANFENNPQFRRAIRSLMAENGVTIIIGREQIKLARFFTQREPL